jgi:hypothetical protein
VKKGWKIAFERKNNSRNNSGRMAGKCTIQVEWMALNSQYLGSCQLLQRDGIKKGLLNSNFSYKP